VSNTMQVFPGGTVSLAGSTLSGGVLAINAGASFTASGTSTIAFSQIDAAAPIVVPTGANVLIRPFTDFDGNNSGRLNILSAAATFDVDGQLTVHPVITGTSGLVKNGTGTMILAPRAAARYTYTGTTSVNAGTLQLGSTSLDAGDALPN